MSDTRRPSVWANLDTLPKPGLCRPGENLPHEAAPSLLLIRWINRAWLKAAIDYASHVRSPTSRTSLRIIPIALRACNSLEDTIPG
jgi:hypothetical protein